MKTETEKKYHYSEHDLKIINEKCEFLSEKKVIDQYLDTADYIITAQWKKVRIRDWKPELKIKLKDNTTNGYSKSIELDTIKEINKELSKIWLNFNDLKEVLIIETNRIKYKYNYKWLDFNIDIDLFKYWKRYEIELTYDDEEIKNAPELIDEVKKYLWLTAEQNFWNWKIAICAEQDNHVLFWIIMDKKRKLKYK